MAAGLFMGIAAGGTLINTIAGFFNAGAQRRAARENYDLEMENIEQYRQAGSDQIQRFNRQGESFMGTQKVASATSGVTGASSAVSLATSKGNMIKDARRMREQLDMNIESAKKKAKINKEAGEIGAVSQNLQTVGSLLTGAGNLYNTGHRWGLY